MAHVSLRRVSNSSGSGEEDATVAEASTLSSISGRSAGVRAGKVRKLVPPLKVDLSSCKYELFRLVACQLGWQLVPEGSSDWDLYWTDTSISQERLIHLKATQRINHLHGMLELCRKRSMAKHLTTLASMLTPDLKYDFFPQTWQLPDQLNAFLAAAKAAGKKQAFIVKPDAGCQGKGIRLLQGGPEATVLKHLAGLATLEAVAQQYLTRPLLINGLKFDLRVYVLVTDVDPLRVFIFQEGLVRICTTPYKKPTSKNLDCAYMHLTNYAVNKTNCDGFVAPADNKERAKPGVEEDEDSSASKWTFLQLKHHLQSQGHDWSALWNSIGQLVVKSLLSVVPCLAATYRATVVDSGQPLPAVVPGAGAGVAGGSSSKPGVSASALAAGSCRCFEVLGYDVLVDADLSPWLIEVNHSPSFNIDSPLDRAIKEQLILNVIQLVRIDPSSIAAAKKAAKKATQVRLLGSVSAHDSNSLLAAAPHRGCASPDRVEQRAYRDVLTAARDRWQDRHLGSFERLYPVPFPQQLKAGQSRTSNQQSAARDSTANLSQLQDLQDCYDKILRISQQLYQGQLQQQQHGHSPPRSPVKINAFRAGCSPGRMQGSPLRNVTVNSSSNPSKLARQHQQPQGGAANKCGSQHDRPGLQQEVVPASDSNRSDNKLSSVSDAVDEMLDTALEWSPGANIHAMQHSAHDQWSSPASCDEGVTDTGDCITHNAHASSTGVEAALAALAAALATSDNLPRISRPRLRSYSTSGGSRPASSSASFLASSSNTGCSSFADQNSSVTQIKRPLSASGGAGSSLLHFHQPFHAMPWTQQKCRLMLRGDMQTTAATAAKPRPQSAPRSDLRTLARINGNGVVPPGNAACLSSKDSAITCSSVAMTMPQHAETIKTSLAAGSPAHDTGTRPVDWVTADQPVSKPRTSSGGGVSTSHSGDTLVAIEPASLPDAEWVGSRHATCNATAVAEANVVVAALTAATVAEDRSLPVRMTGAHSSRSTPPDTSNGIAPGAIPTLHQRDQQLEIAAGISRPRSLLQSKAIGAILQSPATRPAVMQQPQHQHTVASGQSASSRGSSRYVRYVSSNHASSKGQQPSLTCGSGATGPGALQPALASMMSSSLRHKPLLNDCQPVPCNKSDRVVVGGGPAHNSHSSNTNYASLQIAQEVAGISVQLTDRAVLRGSSSSGGLLGRLRLQGS